MEPEETKQGGKKKFLIITLSVILIGLGVVVYIYYNNSGKEQPEALVIKEIPREPTEAEKLLKAQVDELDRVRGIMQSTTTLQSQVKSLDSLRNKTATKVAPKTVEQQVQELDAIRATLNK